MPYRRIENEDGEVEFVEVDFNELVSDIPDDVFYEDGRYKEVADRDYKRRQTVKELKERLESVDDTPGEEEVEDNVEQPEQPAVDIEELTARIASRVREQFEAERSKQDRIRNLAAEHNLPDEFIPMLERSANPEEDAQLLAKTSLRFDDSSGGEQRGNNDGVFDPEKFRKSMGFTD